MPAPFARRATPAPGWWSDFGNPGPRHENTRHNVGWWVIDRFAFDHDFGPFVRGRQSFESAGRVGERRIRLLKPRTWMNRSGLALTRLWREEEEFRIETDLLVVTDDTNLDVGRIRFRRSGGAGGHNGLKSISGTLGTQSYARLRIGVGVAPAGEDLADWVLAPLPPADEETIVALLPELSQAIEIWAEEGIDAAMNRYNR